MRDNRWYNGGCCGQMYSGCYDRHRHHQCKDGAVFSFLDLNPIPFGTMPETSGNSGFMYYSGGKFWRMDMQELGYVLRQILPETEVTWQDIQAISYDGDDIKFVFPPNSKDPKKFTLYFDNTNTLKAVIPVIQAQLTDYTTNQLPSAISDNIDDLFIKKYEKGNCTVEKNAEGGYDINYNSASPVDIASILTPTDLSKTPILFTEVESGTKVQNAFNIPVFNGAVADALLANQDPSSASDLTISVNGGKVSYVLRNPIPTFKDNDDFKFSPVTMVRIGSLRASVMYEGKPNWAIPNKYTDEAVNAIAAEWTDYIQKTINPLIDKVDADVYPWTDSPTFTVQIVEKDGKQYYEGTASGGGSGLTPEAFLAFVDKDKSNVTVAKVSETTISLNSAGGKPTPQDINSVIKQDDDMTTSVVDNLLSFLPNWAKPNSYTDKQVTTLTTSITQYVQEFTDQVSYLQSEIDDIKSGTGETFKQIQFDSLNIHEDKSHFHGADMDITTWLKFTTSYVWDDSLADNLTAPNPSEERIMETINVASYDSIKTDKILNLGRTFYYLQIGGKRTDVIGYLNPVPDGITLDCTGLTTDFVDIRVVLRQNKVYGAFNYDGNAPAAYIEKTQDDVAYDLSKTYAIGATVKIKTSKGTYTIASLNQYIQRWLCETNQEHCIYAEQLPVISIKANKDDWHLTYKGEGIDAIYLYEATDFSSYVISTFANKTVFISLYGSFKAFLDAIYTGKLKLDATTTFKVRFNSADYDKTKGAPKETALKVELKDMDFNKTGDNQYICSKFVSPDDNLIIEVECTYNQDLKTLVWNGGIHLLDDATLQNKTTAYFKDMRAGGMAPYSYKDSSKYDYWATFNFISSTTSNLLNKYLTLSNSDGYNFKYYLNTPILSDNEISPMEIMDEDLQGFIYSTAVPNSEARVTVQGGDLVCAFFVTDVLNSEQLNFDINFNKSINASESDINKSIIDVWGNYAIFILSSDGVNDNISTRKVRINIIDKSDNIFRRGGNKMRVSFYLNGGKVASIDIPIISQDGTISFCPPYNIVVEWDIINKGEIDLVSYTYSPIVNVFGGSKQIRYDNLSIQDDKTIFHGDVSQDVYNKFASVYNWGRTADTKYTVLPAPFFPISRPYETITIPALKAGKTTNIGRTYNYFQLGRNAAGLTPEPQGTIIQAENVSFSDYSTVRLLARQNKLYGTFDCLAEGIPTDYIEKSEILPESAQPIGATVKISCGGKEYILFSMKQYIHRYITTTVDYDCMYSDQIPLTVIKIKNDSWYLAFEDEEILKDLLALYDTKDFTAYTKISDFNSKTVFFSRFGSFDAFVASIMSGKFALDSTSIFKVRFNIADFDDSGLPLPTCFDYELKDWNFSQSPGLTDADRYLGSTFVSPRETMIIEVTAKYDSVSGKLTWNGGNYVLDDSEFVLKEAALIRDKWAGGMGIYSPNYATFNFVTNTNSSEITRFNLIDQTLDGYNNKYIVNIFKVLIESNEFDLRFFVGDIDVNRYFDSPGYSGSGSRLAVYDEINKINGIFCQVDETIERVEINCHFTSDADYTPLSWIQEGFNHWYFQVPVKPNGGTSTKIKNSTVDRIRINFSDQTTNLTGGTLKMSVLAGDSTPAAPKILASISLDVPDKYPPYKIVLDWDSAAPSILKIVEFTYARKFT